MADHIASFLFNGIEICRLVSGKCETRNNIYQLSCFFTPNSLKNIALAPPRLHFLGDFDEENKSAFTELFISHLLLNSYIKNFYFRARIN